MASKSSASQAFDPEAAARFIFITVRHNEKMHSSCQKQGNSAWSNHFP